MMDGVNLCRKLREEAHIATPVLMLTARDALEDKLAGFVLSTYSGSRSSTSKPRMRDFIHSTANISTIAPARVKRP